MITVISSVVTVFLVGAIQALLGIFQRGLSGWWHSVASGWLLTSIAIVALIIVGFALGVLYALSAGAFLLFSILGKLLKHPSPKRGWWWAPADWAAIGAVWVASGVGLAGFWVWESLQALLHRSDSPSSSESRDEEIARIRAELERKDAEIERLRNAPSKADS